MNIAQTLNPGSKGPDGNSEKTASARSLARLLFHAMLDAESIGSDATAEKIRDGIELLKTKFAFTEDELFAHVDMSSQAEATETTARQGSASLLISRK